MKKSKVGAEAKVIRAAVKERSVKFQHVLVHLVEIDHC